MYSLALAFCLPGGEDLVQLGLFLGRQGREGLSRGSRLGGCSGGIGRLILLGVSDRRDQQAAE